MRITGPSEIIPFGFQANGPIPPKEIINEIYNLRYALMELQDAHPETQSFQLLLIAKSISRLWNQLKAYSPESSFTAAIKNALCSQEGKYMPTLHDICNTLVDDINKGKELDQDIWNLKNSISLVENLKTACNSWRSYYGDNRQFPADPNLEHNVQHGTRFIQLFNEFKHALEAWHKQGYNQNSTQIFAAFLENFRQEIRQFATQGSLDGIEQFFLDDLLHTPLIAYNAEQYAKGGHWTLLELADRVTEDPNAWTLLAETANPSTWGIWDILDDIETQIHIDYQYIF